MPASPSKWPLTGLAVLALLGAVALGAGLWVKANAHRIGPLVGDAVERATGRRLTIAQPVRPIFALRPGLAAENLTLANAPWGSRPDMARIGRLEIRLALWPLLQGRIVVHRLALEDTELWLEVDAQGRANWSPEAAPDGAGPSRPETGSPTPRPDLRGLAARGLRVNYVDARAGGRTRRLELAALDLHDPGDGPSLELRLEGLLDSRPLTVAGRIGRLAALLDPAAPWPVDLDLALAGLNASAAGRIQRVAAFQAVDLQVALRESAPGDLQALTGWAWLPGGAPIEGRARLVDSAPGVWRLTDLALRRDPSDLAGTLEIHSAARPIRLAGRLSARHLDLRPFLAPAPAAQAPGSRLFPETPLHLGGLKAVDLALELEAGELRLPRLAADQAGLSVNLAGGRLETVFRQANVGPGRLTGRLVLEALSGSGAALALALEGKGLDVDELLRDLGQPAAVSGDIDVSLDVRGRGASTAGIMASLDGRATLLMGRGTLDSGALRLVGADLATALQRLLNPVRDTSGDTAVNCFVCRLESRAGKVAVEALFWDTESMTVFGDGGLDLRTERLDLGLRPVPKRGIANFSLSLGELTQPFRLGGTLTAPSLVVDRTRTAVTVGKAVGGTLLLGPVGAAAALLSTSRGEDNPCLKALAAAEEAPPPSAREPGPARRATDAVKEGARGVGRSLKDMLGR